MTKFGISSALSVCEVLSLMGYYLVLEIQPNTRTECFVENSEHLTVAEAAVGDFGGITDS